MVAWLYWLLRVVEVDGFCGLLFGIIVVVCWFWLLCDIVLDVRLVGVCY